MVLIDIGSEPQREPKVSSPSRRQMCKTAQHHAPADRGSRCSLRPQSVSVRRTWSPLPPRGGNLRHFEGMDDVPRQYQPRPMDMKRRDLIRLSAGAAAAWPLPLSAQQATMPVIGYLSARSPGDTAHLVAAFRRGLGDAGFTEGGNVTIEYRWALGQYDRLPALAAELARRPVTVLASTGGEPAALAAKAATSTIPIVFAIGGDPVKQGLTASFSRPEGNATGISLLTNTLEPKRLGLLREMVSRGASIGVLLNPSFPPAQGQLDDIQEAARAANLRLRVFRANTDGEIAAAFDAAARERVAALAVTASPFFDTRRDKLVTLARDHAVPTMYHFREFAEAGGLVSYGIDASDVYRQVGSYVGRILKGVKPADLPVMQASKFELVVNLKTAKALGLTIPQSWLLQADELIR
jgi:putative ABC transport system substrate-binding protein